MSSEPPNTTSKLTEIEYNWIINVYLPTLGQEKAAALDQLHNATNWGLTLVTTALLLTVTKQGFPDTLSLYVLLIAYIMGFHFFTRTLKGYINVIRWALLQRMIVEIRLQENASSSDKAASNLANLIDQYHVKWLLPLRRSDVFIKGLFELGYGYILGAVIATIVYTTLRIQLGWAEWGIILIGVSTVGLELVLLFRSPYLRIAAPHENARKMR